MFSRNLSNITLTSDLAEEAFGNIRGVSFNGDTTFVATLRALLLPRIGENSVRLFETSSDYRRSAIESTPARDFITAAIRRMGSDRILIHNLCANNPDDRKAFMDLLDDEANGFVKQFPDFTELKDIRAFVEKVINARFYTSEELKATVIVVDSLNTKKWHYIQSFMPRYFKWYFKDAGYTEEEKLLLASLTMKSADEYRRRIEEFAEKYDLRAILIQRTIGNFEKRSRTTQLERIDNEISDMMDRMRRIMDEYSDYVNRLDERNMLRNGIQQAIDSASNDSELVDFFKANKGLEPLHSEGSRLDFIVKTYLDGFDPDMYETMAARDGSHIYHGYDVRQQVFRDNANRKKFLDAIFSSEPKLRIKICAYYQIDMRGTVRSSSGYYYPESCSDMLPNPHLQRHNCLGNHQRYIQDRLKNGDLVGAVGQCIASAKSINVGESATFPYFLGDLFNSNNKVIELPDGNSVTPAEAFKWLLDQEAASATEVHEDGQAD